MAKCGLNLLPPAPAPATRSRSSKLGEDNVHMLEPASTGKSLCPLSHREVKKREGGGMCRSPSPDGAVKKKGGEGQGEREAAWGRGCVAQRFSHAAGSRFLWLLQRFCSGFVPCCHQQELLHPRCIGEGKGDHLP